ncbi:MAG TPA: hypothetical protein DCX07_00735 [Phycisphaerales bacterium]|nr:hypothetical protein [Phycisphaerales bacterium]
MRKALIPLVLTILALTPCVLGDWPQFLGPDRTGVAKTDAKLARSWPADGPQVLWTVALGEGFAGPAVKDGKVYLLDRQGDNDVLRCLNLADGKELWKYSYAAPGRFGDPKYAGSRTTPTVGDKFVFTVGPFGHLHCVSLATHQPVWSHHILKDFGGGVPGWNVAQSPVLYKNWVIVAPQSKQAGLAAYEQATGKLVWKSEPFGSMQYASPLVTTIDGVDQVLMVANQGKGGTRIVGADARDGKILWSYTGWNCNIPVPSVTAIGDGRFFITGDYGAGCAMWKVARSGQSWEATELFRNRNSGSHIHNALLYEGHLYSNSSRDGKGLVCQDLEGKTVWNTGKSPSFDLGGNLIIVNDLIYILDGNGGALHVVEASAAGYKQLAKADLLEGQKVWAPMAFSGGKLLIRDQKQLRCVDVTAR